MQSFRGSWLFSASHLLMLLCTCSIQLPPAQAQESTSSKPAWLTADVDRLNRISNTESKLNSKVTFSYKDQTLKEVLKDLSKQAGVAITFKEEALEDIGVSIDSHVTTANRLITLEEAFQQILGTRDLSYYVRESDIEVTSVDDANRNLVVRVYDLAQVTESRIDSYELAMKLSQVIDPDQWRDFGGTGDGTMIPFGSALVVAAPISTHRGLAKALRSVAATPSYWKLGDAGEPRWNLGKAYTVYNNSAVNFRALSEGKSAPAGALTLPSGTTYELIRIKHQSADEPKSEVATNWTKPESPAPNWLTNAPETTDTVEALRWKLRQPIDVDVDGQPLNAALDQVFGKIKAAYWINESELEYSGIAVDTAVHLKIESTSIQSVLYRMLEPLDLTYRIGGNSIQITSVDNARDDLSTRFYDLTALSDQPFDMRALMELISQVVHPDEWSAWGGTGSSSLIPFGATLSVSAPEATLIELDGLLCQLATMHAGNFPKADQRKIIKIESVMSGIPGGSTIQIPADGLYQIYPQINR